MSELPNEKTGKMRAPELLHQEPREQMMNLPQFYVIAGLISWQPFIRQNDKGFEALVEIIFLCCLVNTGESGWTGTIVI